MSNGVDERGSKLQRLIYSLAQEAYPHLKIKYEQPIHDLNQRIDIFIPVLGVAIEIHGEQHYKYNSFFFKDEAAWNKSVNLDRTKATYLHDKGIKLVEIPYNTKISTAEELKSFIDSVSYPATEYEELDNISKKKREFLEKQREYRKSLYRKNKNNK